MKPDFCYYIITSDYQVITIYLWALFGHSFKILWNWALNHRTDEYSRYLELSSLKWPSNRSLCRNIQNCLPQGLLIVMLLWSVTILGTSRWIPACCESTWDQVDKLTLHSECQPPRRGALQVLYPSSQVELLELSIGIWLAIKQFTASSSLCNSQWLMCQMWALVIS